ncbi:acetylglutamate kinase [Candidatus Poribacteria bacterium]|nr:acetylglutamate kinase [Candidatus Poribacteria bacterium]
MSDLQENIKKADVLIEALKYIKGFYGKTIVVKYGGNAMVDDILKEKVILDIVLMKYVGMNPVVIHGGGPKISQMMDRVGKKAEFVQGLRVTDADTMELAEMVLGKISKDIVALINQHGAKAVGISGKDAGLIKAEKCRTDIDIGFVGDVVEIDPRIINVLDREGFIPVISSIGICEKGQTYNINADSVAGEIAGALKAEKLILLTDVRGIMKDKKDEKTLVSSLKISDIDQLKEDGIISGGMLPKVEACVTALKGGVKKTHIVDGRISHSLLLEIFTDSGIGTQIIH